MGKYLTNSKDKGDGLTVDDLSSIIYPKSNTGKIIKSTIQLVDPTGISSWPDVGASAVKLWENPSWRQGGDLAMEVVGALPLIGKIGKSIKLIKKGSNVIKFKNATKSVNKAVDTLPELIPGIRKLATKTQDVTTKYLTNPIYNKINRGNKKYYNSPEYADIAVDVVNGLNSGMDIYQLSQNINDKFNENRYNFPRYKISSNKKYDFNLGVNKFNSGMDNYPMWQPFNNKTK